MPLATPRMYTVLFFCTCIIACCMDVASFAQTAPRWKAHDMTRPRPRKVTPADQQILVEPPTDAIVLFDGRDLSQWRDEAGGAAKWIVKDGYMESVPDSGYIFTARGFGDVQLHVEWAAPLPAAGTGQGRGNSGVFLMGLYELQVLDSYENATYADGQAASVYGQYPPLVNATRPPGEWQSYDIIFRRPRFRADGSLERKARVTVLHNGVLVQDAVEFWGPTNWLKHAPYASHAEKLPLSLQDHGNPVRFRNIWLRQLRETIGPGPAPVDQAPVVSLPAIVMQKYVGTYRYQQDEDYRMVLENDRLYAVFNEDRKLELVAHSTSEFSTPWTAAKIKFDLAPDGKPRGFTFYLGGEERVTQRTK